MNIDAMVAVLGISTTVLASDPTPAATVTTLRDGRAATQTGQTANISQGVALATLGTGQIEAKVGRKQWEDALTSNHIRVAFDKPQVIVLNVTSGEFRGEKSLVASRAFPRSVMLLDDRGLASIGGTHPKVTRPANSPCSALGTH